MRREVRSVGLVVVAVVAGCKSREAPPAPSPGSAVGSGVGSASATPDARVVDDPPAFDPGPLATPESVLYDAGGDTYLIANIRGDASATDDNGYITRASPDGGASSRWIDGAAADTKLDAPKGMAIVGDVLYVADITVVRRFDARSGTQLPDIPIRGAQFLNDVVPDGDGGVLVSDTAGNAIYRVAPDGAVSTRSKDRQLQGPNGLWADKGTLWVVTFNSNELYEVDAAGTPRGIAKLPKGQLDGIVRLDDGTFLIASWEGKCVYRGKPGGAWTPVLTGVESPADIGYDPKRQRLLIPSFNANQLVVHAL